MDGGICNRGHLPGRREPLICGRKGRRRPADACGPRPPAPQRGGVTAGTAVSPQPPLSPRSCCQQTNCASDFAVPKIAAGSGGVTSAAAAVAGAGKDDAARRGVR